MAEEIVELLERLVELQKQDTDIIPWSSPIPSFGNWRKARVATLGINPSNLEFVDETGTELTGPTRRFHTLSSLNLKDWNESQDEHLLRIINLCDQYFQRNPYDSWFKKLDYIISGSSFSYYFPFENACHLDLVPFATANKWSSLTSAQRLRLLDLAQDTLGLILRDSPIDTLILNGQSVVRHLEQLSSTQLDKLLMEDWSLPRQNSKGVVGYAYKGEISKVGTIELNKQVYVLGFNHNIQSSFGVTKEVLRHIRNWITLEVNEIKDETSR